MTDQYFKISVFFLVSRILLRNIGNPNPNNTHNGDARKQIPSSIGSDMHNSGNALNFSALFVKKKRSAHNTDVSSSGSRTTDWLSATCAVCFPVKAGAAFHTRAWLSF